jgi:hypothetical protein
MTLPTSATLRVSSFADYFRLNVDVDQVVGWFGYTFAVIDLTLPQLTQPLPWIDRSAHPS